MFDRFKPKDKDAAELTALNLRPDAPKAVAAPAKPAPAPPAAPQPIACPQLLFSLETSINFAREIRRRVDQFIAGESKPDLIFYLVYPQQGHPLSFSTPDGQRTIIQLFSSTIAAEAFAASRKLPVVPAGCRFESVANQAEKWSGAGINSYAWNACARCGGAAAGAIADLQSTEALRESWGTDAVTRRHYGEILLRVWNQSFSKDPVQSRKMLEGFRDHVDPCAPYLYVILGGLAGMAGDKAAAEAAGQRLQKFGPPFNEMLKPGSIDPADVETWSKPVADGTLGLLAAYGILNLPMKPANG